MGPRIIHVGLDDCHRIAVLKNAGYEVVGCNTNSLLHAALVGVHEISALLISESDDAESSDDAISLTCSNSTAPLILFQSESRRYDESEFDLVIRRLTAPREWLSEIAMVIEQRRSGICSAVRNTGPRRRVSTSNQMENSRNRRTAVRGGS
jgi:hypothetical protein